MDGNNKEDGRGLPEHVIIRTCFYSVHFSSLLDWNFDFRNLFYSKSESQHFLQFSYGQYHENMVQMS